MPVTEQEARRHIKRYERLRDRRGNFDALLQEVTEYVWPSKSTITVERSPGERQTDLVYDPTITHAVTLLAAVMAGSLHSQHLEWIHLKMREEELNQEKEVQDWLEDDEQKMYLAMRQSNFQQEMHEGDVDLIVCGTACVFIEERPRLEPDRFGGLRFTTIPFGSYVVAESAEGLVNTLYRSYEMTAAQLVEMGQARGWMVGDEIRDAMEADPDKPFEVLHCVYPRGQYNPASPARTQMPFASLYIQRKPVRTLAEGGYEEFPFIVPRWSKTTREVYGRGPAIHALPEVRTLNAAREMFLRAAAKNIDPPTEVEHEAILGSLDLAAGGVNPRGPGATPGQPAIVPINAGGKLDWTQFTIQDERQLVKEMCYWDQLSLQTAGSQPTATEIERRWEIMRRVLGPTLGRFEAEALNPLIDRVFGIMFRAGVFGSPPEIIRQGGQELDVEYEGPLARSQRPGRMAGGGQMIAITTNIAASKQDPAVWDNFDVDGMVRDAANIAGLPNRYLTDRRKMEQTRAARTAAMQQQNQLDTAQQIGETAGKAAPALKALSDAAAQRNGQMTEAA